MIKEILKYTDLEGKKHLMCPCKDYDDDLDGQAVIDLFETFDKHKKEAYGLSANQIGYDVKAFIMRNPESGQFMVVTNPKIVIKSPKTFDSDEQCLSLPNMPPVRVKRHKYIAFSSNLVYCKYKGAYVRAKCPIMYLHGIAAVCFQHEMDHLSGEVI